MADKNAPVAIASLERDRDAGRDGRETCCVHTKKIYDACRDKDCMEDIRVYMTRCGQHIVDKAINVKCRKAELIWVFVDVEAVSFNRGFYTVDVKYFYRITADAFCGIGRPAEVEGLATFDKRVILFGSEGNAKIYSSRASLGEADEQRMRQANMPIAVVEVVDYKLIKRPRWFVGDAYYLLFMTLQYHKRRVALCFFTLHPKLFRISLDSYLNTVKCLPCSTLTSAT